MITRAQAKALLTLAESLEACKRVSLTFTPGTLCTWVHVPGESCALEDGMTGQSIRSFVAEHVKATDEYSDCEAELEAFEELVNLIEGSDDDA